MKKCFRGYSVRQVDELITSLQNQNDDLVAKVTSLTMQLSAIDSNAGGVNGTDTLSRRIQELESRSDAEKKAFEERIKELSDKNAELTRKINEVQYGAGSERADPSKVGEICSRAYSDMAKMKEEAAEGLVRQINVYTNLVSESNAQMVEALRFVEETYDDLLATVVEHLESIFTKLEIIDTGKEKIRNSIMPVKDIAADLNNRVQEALEKSMREQRKDELDTLRKLGQDPVYAQSSSDEQSPWESFKERHIKGTAADLNLPQVKTDSRVSGMTGFQNPSPRIIGIRANVAADEVFNSEAELA